MDERNNPEGFEPLPRRFLETSKVLLDVYIGPAHTSRGDIADTCVVPRMICLSHRCYDLC
jgi:hypothetical protein